MYEMKRLFCCCSCREFITRKRIELSQTLNEMQTSVQHQGWRQTVARHDLVNSTWPKLDQYPVIKYVNNTDPTNHQSPNSVLRRDLANHLSSKLDSANHLSPMAYTYTTCENDGDFSFSLPFAPKPTRDQETQKGVFLKTPNTERFFLVSNY